MAQWKSVQCEKGLKTTIEQRIFSFWLIIKGTTEKVLQFIRQLKSIYPKNLGFVEQKNLFWNTPKRFKQEKVY